MKRLWSYFFPEKTKTESDSAEPDQASDVAKANQASKVTKVGQASNVKKNTLPPYQQGCSEADGHAVSFDFDPEKDDPRAIYHRYLG